MSLTNSKHSVEQITPDSNVTYLVTLQSANTGKSAIDFVSPLLTYNTGLGKFFVNNKVVPTSNVISLGSVVTSPTPPPSPAVGDLWYDTTSDIQFEYVYDGVNYQWVDITGPTISIGGPVSTNNITYTPLTANANTISSVSVILQAGSSNSVNFSTFTSVSGGYTAYPYTYFIISGTLPASLTLDSSTGIVSGRATTTYSSSNVVFGVKDVTGYVAPQKLTVNFTVAYPIYALQYLIVGGGGGGAGAPGGGGGGAGGFVTGPSIVTKNTSYPITVGGNGLGVIGGNGQPGGGSQFRCIFAPGGGGGAATPTISPSNIGASGGGGAAPAGTGATATGSPGPGAIGTYGFPGGNGNPTGGAGGGGGSGGVGGPGTGTAPSNVGGAGGTGSLWPYTGCCRYAGGGGGSGLNPGPAAYGGAGGGPVAGQGGASARLGGGGGGSNSPFGGGKGGAGVVILAVPNAEYPTVIAPGAVVTTPPAAPGYTILTYNTPAPTPAAQATFTFTA